MKKALLPLLLLCTLPCTPPACAADDTADTIIGIVKEVARSTMIPQVPLPMQKASVAMVFIGGMADEWTGIMHHVADTSPNLPIGGTQLRAYYHWHLDTEDESTQAAPRLAEQLQAFRALNPKAPLVIMGHSLGASTALRTAALLDGKPGGPVYLVTLDPVDRRTTPMRPKCVTWWGNSYIVNSQDARDFIPQIGGRWNACAGADVNILMDGRERDEYGYYYQHGGAMSQLYCKGQAKQSLYLQLCEQIKKAPR